jgi:hypothetical protein
MYDWQGNPLFIPETLNDIRAAAQVYYALGQHNALGFSPFGIDGIENISSISEVYSSLSGFLPFLAEYRKSDNCKGLIYSGEKTEIFSLGGFTLKVTYRQERDELNQQPESGGMVLAVSEDEFYAAGFGFRLDFEIPDNTGWVETLSHEEGRFENGTWIQERRMNGDELPVILPAQPSFRKVRVHRID